MATEYMGMSYLLRFAWSSDAGFALPPWLLCMPVWSRVLVVACLFSFDASSSRLHGHVRCFCALLLVVHLSKTCASASAIARMIVLMLRVLVA